MRKARPYWHVFTRAHSLGQYWHHEIGFDNRADAMAEAQDYSDSGRRTFVWRTFWGADPADKCRALNHELVMKGKP